MLDGLLRKVIDPGLNRAGRMLAAKGVRADQVTLLGLGLGAVAALMIASGMTSVYALIPLLASRLADGLDGAVARAGAKSDFGGFLDIVADFSFYGMIPFAFALAQPANALTAAFLILSFYVNGASFLAFAIFAEKRGLATRTRGEKSLYFTAGIMEGSETILFLVAFCLWPAAFPILGTLFAILCLITATARILLARRLFAA